MAFYQRKPDIIIRNGTIIDGTGKPGYYADIAIIGDKIDYIGNLKGVSAPLEIDATGKYVPCPKHPQGTDGLLSGGSPGRSGFGHSLGLPGGRSAAD